MSRPSDADHPPTLDLAAAEPLLRRLELSVRNRLDGLLQGNYLGLVPGPGSEAGESRQYVAGDDVRRMDWPVTARTTVAHVRQTIADRELETWVVVDLSPSVDFGTALTEKRELVLAAITTVVHLTVRGGNRVGALVSNGELTYRIPALSGTAHARYLMKRIAATPRAEGAASTDLATMLDQLRRQRLRRGLVAVVSDYLENGVVGAEPSWERPLRALSARHQLLGIEVLDPRELELPAAGLVTFADPETGRHLEVQTSDASLRRQYAAAAQDQRAAIATSLRHAGAAHLQLRTDRDWLTDVVKFVIARRRFVVGAVGAAVR
ncbi:MAG: hypothetical protein QOF87_1459 [Pseudonocardiales bacterium]|jgi:uncharacterized protein (DUF58 family)|nr:hypothetical protein [Pseudonocardiales bacterium]MDT4910177.1 hypothetical protein [Pseudonocardiales bacterium]MDT4961812.1 hypothetical protein [Pseudonocardiales bacterium]MDT4974556.1 hypothetical protein [Pseudonocardiales bacterium]MDT4980784.1 hypothetical protein [Pseudonocardiales bacterium]